MSATDNKKPSWLAHLEEESWQAELIISGAAIFGCLLLPDLLVDIEAYILNTVNRESILMWYFIMLFANLLAYTLIITFILHFCMRALWIGMVSFNSAYPDGFKPNETYSKDYQGKLQEEFGDINGYISRLDRSCSTIFGSGFSIALLAFGYIIVMVGLGVIMYLASSYLPSNFERIVLGIFFGAIMLSSSMIGYMSKKSMHDKAWVKKWHYPMSKALGKIMMNVGYHPASYVINVLTSHSSHRKYNFVITFLISISIGIIGGMLGIGNMNVDTFIDAVYHRQGNDSTKVSPNAYADTHCNCYTYNPVIPDYEMYEGELLTVFMPLPNREKFEMEKQCSFAPVAREHFDNAERQKRRERSLACAKEYYTFYINDQKITSYELSRHWFGENRQYGFLATFFGADLKSGKNIIRTESAYFNDDGEARKAVIPFYYFPDKSRQSNN